MDVIKFPVTSTALWHPQPRGSPVFIHIAYYRLPVVSLEEQSIRLAQRFAQDCAGEVYTCHLIASVSSDHDAEGIRISIEHIDPEPKHSQLTTGDLHLSCLVKLNSPSGAVNSQHFLRSLQKVQEGCGSKSQTGLVDILAGTVSCYSLPGQSHIVYTDIDLVTPSMVFKATPIQSIPIVTTALSKNLSGPLSMSEVQGEPKSGYLTMDQTRKLLLILESDPKAANLPLVGIWVSGVSLIHDAFVWRSCLRYQFASHLKHRVCQAPEPMLVLLYSPLHSKPEFYECVPKDGKCELAFDLYSCHEVLHLPKALTGRPSSPLEIEMSYINSGNKYTHFEAALQKLSQLKPSEAGRRASLESNQNARPALGTSPEDSLPWKRPAPHPTRTAVVQPSVPEVTLLFDESHPRQSPVNQSTRPSPQPFTLQMREMNKHKIVHKVQGLNSSSAPGSPQVIGQNSPVLTSRSHSQPSSPLVTAPVLGQIYQAMGTNMQDQSNIQSQNNISTPSRRRSGSNMSPEQRQVNMQRQSVIQQHPYPGHLHIMSQGQQGSQAGDNSGQKLSPKQQSVSHQLQRQISGPHGTAFQAQNQSQGQTAGPHGSVYQGQHQSRGQTSDSHGIIFQGQHQSYNEVPTSQNYREPPVSQNNGHQNHQSPNHQYSAYINQHGAPCDHLLNSEMPHNFALTQPKLNSSVPMSNKPQQALPRDERQQGQFTKLASPTRRDEQTNDILYHSQPDMNSRQFPTHGWTHGDNTGHVQPHSRTGPPTSQRLAEQINSVPQNVNNTGHLKATTGVIHSHSAPHLAPEPQAHSQNNAELYELLRKQDTQIQMLREQIALLLANQNPSAQKSTQSVTQNEPQNQERQMCSVACNTSMWLSEQNAMKNLTQEQCQTDYPQKNTETEQSANQQYYTAPSQQDFVTVDQYQQRFHNSNGQESQNYNDGQGNESGQMGHNQSGQGSHNHSGQESHNHSDQGSHNSSGQGSHNHSSQGSHNHSGQGSHNHYGQGSHNSSRQGSHNHSGQESHNHSGQGSQGSQREHCEDVSCISLGEMDLQITRIQDNSQESVMSNMLLDMPEYGPVSPDRSANNTQSADDTGSSPMLGESVSMYQQLIQEDKGESEAEKNRDTCLGDSRQHPDLLFTDNKMFYKNVLENVYKHFLTQEAEMNDTVASAPDALCAPVPPPPAESGGTPIRAYDDCLPVSQDSTYKKARPGRYIDKPEKIDIAKATKQALEKLGIQTEQQQSFREKDSMYLDTALLPRIQYMSMLLDSDSDGSMEMDALAMKYLKDEQLAELAQLRGGGGNVVDKLAMSVSSNVSMWQQNNMSFASRKYLERYGLIDSVNQSTNQLQASGDKSLNLPEVFNVQQFLEKLQETSFINRSQHHSARGSQPSLQRVYSDGSFNEVRDTERPAIHSIAVSDTTHDQSHRLNNQFQQQLPQDNQSPGPPLQRRILDIERLRELPKLL